MRQYPRSSDEGIEPLHRVIAPNHADNKLGIGHAELLTGFPACHGVRRERIRIETVGQNHPMTRLVTYPNVFFHTEAGVSHDHRGYERQMRQELDEEDI